MRQWMRRVSGRSRRILSLTCLRVTSSNPAAFAQPANGTFGNEGRNFLRGPRLTVLNLSLGKEFHFGERFALQLRADFVNALNHSSFQAPHSDIGSACWWQAAQLYHAEHLTSVLSMPRLLASAWETATVLPFAPRSGQLSARFTF